MGRIFYIFLLFIATSYAQHSAQDLCTLPKIKDIQGNENPVIDCSYPLSGKCLQLNVTAPTFYDTSTYNVSPIPFTPPIKFNDGISLNANSDDLFIKKVSLPFNFCFFGNNFNEVVIGTNGKITFDSSQLGNIDSPSAEEQNPNTIYPKNTVFGVMQDLVFSNSDDSEIYYEIIGTAPCRKLVVNFYKGRIVGCQQTSTSQIVISEGSNKVEVFIENKDIPCPTAKFRNALVGIINSDGTIGYSPSDRNTGEWEANNEAWAFSPSGAAINPVYSWFDSKGRAVGTGKTVSVCPENNEIYKVLAKYAACGNFNFTLEAQSSVTFTPDYPLGKNYSKVFCNAASYNINLKDYEAELTPQDSALLLFSYHNSEAEAIVNINAQALDYTLSANKIFYVRVQNKNDPSCFRTAELTLTLLSKSLLSNTAEICDFNNDGIEKNYKLSLLDHKFFGSPINGNIRYFRSMADASNNVNEVLNADLSANNQFYISYTSGNCAQIFGPVAIKFASAPVVNSPINFSYTVCDFKNDDTEPFDFKTNLGPLISTNPNVVFQFFNSYAGAVNNNGGELRDIKEGKYTIYARVEIPGGCFSIAQINLNITFNKVIAEDKNVYTCFDGTQDFDIKLSAYTESMLIEPKNDITITYFLTPLDAETDQNMTSDEQTLSEDGNFVANVFFIKFTDPTGCYALKRLTINLVHVVADKVDFQACDLLNDGKENVALSNYSSGLIGNQNAKVIYYKNREDAAVDKDPILTYFVEPSAQIVAKIISYGCSNIFDINISLTLTPSVAAEINETRSLICDNNNDGVESVDLTAFQSQIYSGVEDVNFQYFENYYVASQTFDKIITDPQNFPVNTAASVFVNTSYTTGCFSVTKINVKQTFLPAVVLKKAVLQKCDYEFNFNETFVLKDALPQLFSQADNVGSLDDMDISFYNSRAAALNNDAAGLIGPTYKTPLSKNFVFAKFVNRNNSCYSIEEISLDTYFPPKALKSTIYNVCDENLDGIFTVNLLNYTTQYVSQTNTNNDFSFYTSEADAQNENNPIVDPKAFNFTVVPDQIWVRVENIAGCFDTASINFTLGTKITFDNSGPFTVNDVCDTGNDGEEIIDLTRFQSQIYSGTALFEYFLSMDDVHNNTNIILKPSQYLYKENSNKDKIFLKVSAAAFCPQLVEINLSLKKTPIFSLPVYYFCPGGFINIQPDFSGLNIVKYEWLNPSGEVISTVNQLMNVMSEGTYKVKVTAANGCTFTTDFSVKKYEVPVITKLIPNGNSFTVIATGSRSILYSINGIDFQESNVFSGLPVGVTTFYVKFFDSECLGEIKQGLLLNIKNAITPNADGKNDTWFVDNLHVFEGEKSSLKIFDRYQKLIFEQESATRFEWNGQTSKRAIPTDSYWYVITLPDGRIINGWIMVKNRN